MNQEEYQSAVNGENKGYRYKLFRNIAIPALGILTSVNLFTYNLAMVDDAMDQAKQEFSSLEMIKKEVYAINKSQSIHNVAVVLQDLSLGGLILLPIIPIIGHKKKKKSLEKELNTDN